MRRALLLGALLLAGCGTGRDLPDAGTFDGGTQAQPVAVSIVDVGFACATITQDFAGNYVCADPDAGVLRVLDSDGLGLSDLVDVVDGGWSSPEVVTGRAGQAFLAADVDGGVQVWAVNLEDDSVAAFTTIPPANGFHARRDAPGFIYAPIAALADGGLASGSAVVIGEDGGVERTFDVGATIQDLASTARGPIFASTSDASGRCSAVLLLGSDAGISLTSGRAPCELGLSPDSSTLWLATDDDGAADVHAYDSTSLLEVGRWSVAGFTPAFHSVLVAPNGTVALLGVAPGRTVALGRPAWLAQDGGFQTVSAGEVSSAPDAVFDDQSALYVADPQQLTIDVVR